jgi:hypothetical protein
VAPSAWLRPGRTWWNTDSVLVLCRAGTLRPRRPSPSSRPHENTLPNLQAAYQVESSSSVHAASPLALLPVLQQGVCSLPFWPSRRMLWWKLQTFWHVFICNF